MFNFNMYYVYDNINNNKNNNPKLILVKSMQITVNYRLSN